MSTQVGSDLWTWRELCQATGTSIDHGPNIQHISIDSRSVSNGDLFIALSGKARPEFNIHESSGRDGHEFIESACNNGAVAALIHQSVESQVPVLLVKESLDALWQMARFRREQLACPVIALTGSSGKTTLKSFLLSALGHEPINNSFNNHIGVPLSIANTRKDASSAIFEVGTNHPGEIEQLTKLIKPNIALVLNVSNAHIGNFSNQEQLKEEKLSIGSGLTEDGTLIVNQDLKDAAKRLYPQAHVLSFGQKEDAEVQYSVDSDELYCEIKTPFETLEYSIPGGGQHRAETLCAAAAVLHSMGESLDKLNHLSVDLPPGRGQTFIVNNIRLIDESYNANPASMRQCLRHLIKFKKGRRIAIVGDMNELGPRSQALHYSLVPLLNQLDGVICIGKNMYTSVVPELANCWISFETIDGVIEYCCNALDPSDNVLIKGSNTVFWTNQFVSHLRSALETQVGSS